MREKLRLAGRPGRGADERGKIRADLESRGVSPALSEPVAARLEGLAAAPGSAVYCAAVDAAAAACDEARKSRGEGIEGARELDELQRLMRGFADELRKVEEGLQIVSAYVLRMHSAVAKDRRGTVH
jgi:hypothetical protein